MMRKKIYTSGKMSGLTKAEAMRWRERIEYYVEHYCPINAFNPTFIHPPVYYNYEENLQKTEREIFEWEISQTIDSDIVVLNIDGVKDSIGTHMELGAISAANKLGKDIKVIAIGKIPDDLHPWIECSWFRHEEDIEEAGRYIAKYLLK